MEPHCRVDIHCTQTQAERAALPTPGHTDLQPRPQDMEEGAADSRNLNSPRTAFSLTWAQKGSPGIPTRLCSGQNSRGKVEHSHRQTLSLEA